MSNKYSLIEEKIVMMPTLVMDGIIEIKVAVPTKYEFIYGKDVPINFEEGIKYIPKYKIINVPKLITI